MSFFNYLKGIVGVGEAGQERRRTQFLEKNSTQGYLNSQSSRTQTYQNLGVKEVDGEALYLKTMEMRKKARTDQFSEYDAKGKEAPEKETILPSAVLHRHHVEQLEEQKGLAEFLHDDKEMHHGLHNQLQQVADKVIPEYYHEAAKSDRQEQGQTQITSAKDQKEHQEHDKTGGGYNTFNALNAVQSSIDKSGLASGPTGIDKQKIGDAKDARGEKMGTHKLTVDDKKNSKQQKESTPKKSQENSKKREPKPGRHASKDTALLMNKLPRKARNSIAQRMAMARSKQAQNLSTSVDKTINQSTINKRILTNVYASKQSNAVRKNMAKAMVDPKMGKKNGMNTASLASRLNKTRTASYQNSALKLRHEYVVDRSYDGQSKTNNAAPQVRFMQSGPMPSQSLTSKVKQPGASGKTMTTQMLLSNRYWEKNTKDAVPDQKQTATIVRLPDMTPMTSSQMFSARQHHFRAMA